MHKRALVYADGQPVGHCNAWEGIDGIGQVEDLFVHPKDRRRGIATALLSACVSLARQRGAGPVVIVVDLLEHGEGTQPIPRLGADRGVSSVRREICGSG